MKNLEKIELQIGYIPLLDCVSLLWAQHRGFFDAVGLKVTLVKEASWASLRDRLAYGILDAAHCLSAMLPTSTHEADPIGIPLQSPLVLSTNRAFISLSQTLCHQLNISPLDSPQNSSEKVTAAIKSGELIHLAHVFNHSIHHYCLREWLALSDPLLARTLQLHILPPPYMLEALGQNIIHGFCVGEPWNTQGELQGLSHVVADSQKIIPNVADKVLAVTKAWANLHPNTMSNLVQAITQAQIELQHLQDYNDVWRILVEVGIIQFDCSETVHVQKYYHIQKIIRNFVQQPPMQLSQHDLNWLNEKMQQWL